MSARLIALPVAFIGLLLVVGLLTGLIVLIVKRPAAGWAVLGMVVAVFLLGLFYVRIRTHDQPAAVVYSDRTIPLRQPAVVRVRQGNLGFGGELIEQAPTTQTAGWNANALVASTAATTQSSKLWVDDWPTFAASMHGNMRVMIAQSSDTCATELEAREQAIADATRQLEPLVLSHMTTMESWVPLSSAARTLRGQIESAVRSGEMLADQYVRKIEKPYGTLYKCYLLVDARPEAFNAIFDRLHKVQHVKMVTAAWRWGSLAGLLGFIVLLYAFLNAATKGYFVWRLRATALLCVIVAVLVVLAVV